MTKDNITSLQFERKLDTVLSSIKSLLIEKNKSYGNSALEPLNIFSKQSASEILKSRIDEKLSRLMRGDDSQNEDTVKDLIGYLILLRVSEINDN
jgi:hypothetical protein